jgi:hypothetical protein
MANPVSAGARGATMCACERPSVTPARFGRRTAPRRSPRLGADPKGAACGPCRVTLRLSPQRPVGYLRPPFLVPRAYLIFVPGDDVARGCVIVRSVHGRDLLASRGRGPHGSTSPASGLQARCNRGPASWIHGPIHQRRRRTPERRGRRHRHPQRGAGGHRWLCGAREAPGDLRGSGRRHCRTGLGRPCACSRGWR